MIEQPEIAPQAPERGSTNVADFMAATLARAGVPRIFGYPGDPIIEFMERCRRREVEVVLARREGSAGFMAEGFAMASGGVGACVSTLGPGSTAMVNPVAAATLDRVPMIAVSGQIDSERVAVFTHQVVDQEQLFRPITKWAARVEAKAALVTMRKALRIATAERPGAVHLSVGADAFTATVGGIEPEVPPLRSARSSVQVFGPAGGDLDPEKMLAAARKPVLLLGIGATRCEAGPAALALARTAGIPILVAPMAKGVVSEDDEWFAGVVEMACSNVVWDLLRSSDLILSAGFDAVELIKPWSVTTPVMHIDTLANVDQIYPSNLEVVGDIALSLEWLAESWHGEPRWSTSDVQAFRRRLLDAYYAGRVEGRLNPTDVVDTVRAAAPTNTIATTDVGSHKILVGQGWTTLEPRSMLMTNGLSSMGFGIPAAIGAALARPDYPVVCLVGDGGFAMSATEIRLAAALELGIVFVVLVDGSLNRIEIKQAEKGYPSTATRIESMDLVRIAEAMECDGERVASITELEAAVTNIGARSRPLVIEAHVDPGQYYSQF